MALSLQDLLVGFDAGAPQAPRANASAPRGIPNDASRNADPFAALFAAKADPAPTPRAAQPTTQPATVSDAPRPRAERPTADAPSDNAATKQSASTAADKPRAASEQKPSRTDDDAPVADTDSNGDGSADATNDKTDGRDGVASVTATPAGVAPVVVDVVQFAMLVDAPATDADTAIDAAAPTTGNASAPGLPIANAVASADAKVPAATADATAPASTSAAVPNPIAELLAKAGATQTDTASPLAAFTAAPDRSGKPADPKSVAAVTTSSPVDAPAAPALDAVASDATMSASAPQPVTANAASAPQASAVAQVAVQASREPRATADAVRPIAQSNSATPAPQAATTAQAAAAAARPTDVAPKPSAPRSDASVKPATHAASEAEADQAAPATPAKDNASTPVAPIALAVDETPIATVALAPTPAADNDAPAPTSQAPASAAPIAAPAAAAPQAHQIYAQAAARGAALPQVTVDQVVAHVARAADDGIDRLTIQLKPAHLGAIEVKLEMHDDGGLAKATISADRADTLDLLQRDSHRLERALENAGIKADAGSLSFNLRGDGGRHQPAFAQDNAAASSRPTFNGDDSGLDTAVMAYVNARLARGGVDIRV